MSRDRLSGEPADLRPAGDRRQRHRHAHGDRHPRGVAAAPFDRARPACRGVDAGCGRQHDPGQPARPSAPRRRCCRAPATSSATPCPARPMPARPAGPTITCMICAQPQMWPAMVKVLGRPELADDPRFKTADARWENRDALNAIVEAWTRQRTQARRHATAGRRRRAVRRLPGHRRGAGRPASEGARDDRRCRLPDPRHLQDRRLPGQTVGFAGRKSPARRCSASTPPNCCTICAASIPTR